MKAGKKDKKEKQAAEPAKVVPDEPEVFDPNALKFIPHVVHLSRDTLKTVSAYLSFMSCCMNFKKEESCGLVIEDNNYDSLQSEIVDFAFSSGVVEYLNLTGLGKPEKSCKVQRFVQILDAFKSVEETPAENQDDQKQEN